MKKGGSSKLLLANNGKLTVSGDNNVSGVLTVDSTTSSSSGANNGLKVNATQTAASSGSIEVISSEVFYSSSGTLVGLSSYGARPRNDGTGTVTTLSGYSVRGRVAASSTVTNSMGFQAINFENYGTETNQYGLYVANQTSGVNDYGVYIQGADSAALYVEAGNVILNPLSGGGTRCLQVDNNGVISAAGSARSSLSSLGNTVIRDWTSADTAIDSLIPGTNQGGFIQAPSQQHLTIGILGNDTNDAFTILTNSDNTAAATAADLDYNAFTVRNDEKVGIGSSAPGSLLDINSQGTNSGIYFNGQQALTGYATDNWLRLNNGNLFTNGVYTPGIFRADDYAQFLGGVHVGGTSDPGTDNLVVDGTSTLTGTILPGGIVDFTDSATDKIHLFSNTCGIGIEGGTLTNWSGSQFRWRTGGTSVSSGTERMLLTTSGLSVIGKIVATGNEIEIQGTLDVTAPFVRFHRPAEEFGQIRYGLDGVGGHNQTFYFRNMNANTSAHIHANNIISIGTITGNGSGLTTLNASNLSSGTIASARLSGTYAIAISGSASTASALAANGANCSSGSYSLGVNAAGAVESCTSVSSSETDPQVGSFSGADQVGFWNGSQINGNVTFRFITSDASNRITMRNDGTANTNTKLTIDGDVYGTTGYAIWAENTGSSGRDGITVNMSTGANAMEFFNTGDTSWRWEV